MKTTTENATLTLSPIVADLEQLRGLERLLGRAGTCRVRRFDKTFESLDALAAVCPLPQGHLSFEAPGVKVQIARNGVSITHDGEATGLICDIELYLRNLAAPPVLRWLNPLMIMLAIALFAAVDQGAYAILLIGFVVMAVLEHTAFEARAKIAVLKLRADWTLDPRLGIGLVGLVIVLAKLVQRLN